MATASGWTGIAKGLHWLVALLLVAVWGAVELHEVPAKGSPWQNRWMVIHFSLGLTVLLLMILWLYWRSRHPRPATIGSPWQKRLSGLVHFLLYITVIAMPMLGFMMRQFAGKPVDFYGLTLPQLVTPDKAIAKDLELFHTEIFWYLLLGLAAVHILGALWHHFVDHDDTLKRMLPGRR